MARERLSVCEYFYSLQGEGRTMGIPAVFLRLAGCNLMCGGQGTERDKQLHDGATWRCDTIEVWMHGKSRPYGALISDMDLEINFITRLREGAHLVITGGEPLMQMEQIIGFLAFLEQEFNLIPIVEIETNATVLPLPELDKRVQYWNTSPKLRNSGMPHNLRVEPDVLKWFAQNPNTMSKFVISSEADWQEITADFLNTQLITKSQIVLMPAASSIEELLVKNKLIADICIRECVRMSTRLHVEIWNQLTGV